MLTPDPAGGSMPDDSGSFLQAYFDAGIIGMLIVSQDKRLVNFNDAYCNMLGYTRAEMSAMSWVDHTHPDDVGIGREQRQQVLDGLIDGYACEKRYLHKDGHTVHVSIATKCIRNDDGTVRNFITFVRDISKRKQEENRLKLYEQILNSYSYPMFYIDKHYTYQAVNDAFLTTFNKKREDVINHSIVEIMGSSHFEQYSRPNIDRCLAGEAINYQDWFTNQTGNEHYLEISYIPYWNDDKEVSGVVVAIYDITDLKKAQLSLEKKEKQLREAQRISQVGFWERSFSDNILFLSDELYEIYGISKDDFDGRRETMVKYFHPDDRSDALQHYDRVLHDRDRHFEFGHRIIRPDGEVRHVQVQGEVMLDAAGNPMQIMGATIDITKQKQIEENMRKSEARLREAQRIAGLGFWEWDLKESKLYWSDELYRICGRSRDEYEPSPDEIMDCIHAEDRELVRKSFHAALYENRPYRTEHRFIHPDGKVAYHQITGEVRKDATGVPVAMMGTAMDITILKENELRLKEAQRIGGLGFWEWDMKTNEVYWSDELYRISGYDRNEFKPTNQAILMHVHPEDREAVRDCVRNAIRNNRPYLSENRYITPEGELRYHQISGEVKRDINGEPISMIGTILDITGAKLAELEIKRHRDHLEDLVNERTMELKSAQQELIRNERLATLGKLTATVSHELRNPLGASSLALYTLRKFIDVDNPVLVETFKRLDRNIRRCDNIIDELLDFTRIGNFDLQAFQLDGWLQELLDEYDFPQGISVRQDFRLGQTMVRFDTDRLRRAVINILDNGCHAMASDNDPTVIIAGSTLKISTRMTKHRIEIIVSDQGKGIPDHVMPNIFEPLYSTKNFGVGLGLPTVKQIMEQHGGSIEISSRDSKGVDVTLCLPLTLIMKKVAS